MEPIRSAVELYAHAIAVEREAAERYAEFAQRMNDLGEEAVAAVFGRLAGLEAEHLGALERGSRPMNTAGSTRARPRPRRASWSTG
jgi:rubrerythrin